MRFLVVFMLIARVAAAHQSSTKYLELGADGDRATLELRFVPGDVTEPMKLDPNAKPSARAVVASPAVAAYVARWIAVRECTAGPATARIAEDGFVAVSWVATCPRDITTIVLDATAFFSLDRKMELFVHTGGETSLRITADKPAIAIELARHSLLPTILAHVAFCLLIAFVASRARHPMRAAAIGVISYSLACFAGALSGIDLPYADLLVAITVVYATAESLLRPDWRWRTATFTAFGIVHGMADSHQPFTFDVVVALGSCALTFACSALVPTCVSRRKT